MFKKAVIVGVVMFLAFSPVYAQQPGQPGAGVTTDDVTAEGNVSLDFRDADIQNVLRILSYKSGLNIVTGPEVTGLVTIKLKDVPWRQALELCQKGGGWPRPVCLCLRNDRISFSQGISEFSRAQPRRGHICGLRSSGLLG